MSEQRPYVPRERSSSLGSVAADRPVDSPGTGPIPLPAGVRSGQHAGELLRGLREVREEAADRVPVALRAVLPAGVPWRAAIMALIVAVLAGSALLSRASASAHEEVVPAVGARTTTSRTGGSVTPGRAVVSLASPTGSGAGPPASSDGRVVVHVAGRVRRPGLVRLPSGSRVWDAVAAAGGAASGARLDRLNLARPLVDGEKLTVPDADDPLTAGPAAEGPSAAAGGSSPATVDLNTATAADLDTLPGVGPVLAGRVIAWRTQHGRFSRVEELGEVPGIGDKLLAQLTPLVRV